MVITLLQAFQPADTRILDLGCGDGIVTEMLLQALPGSTICGVDSSPPMLVAAEQRLQAYRGRYSLVQGDLVALGELHLPSSFDAAIGVQSIHHLDGQGKQALFRQVAARLRFGGLFLLSDRVMLPSAALFSLHSALWNYQRAKYGLPPAWEDFGYAAHLQALALQGDVPDTVEDQLLWLREAGFSAADCFYRLVERAIFGGLKLPPTPSATPLPDDHSAAAKRDTTEWRGF